MQTTPQPSISVSPPFAAPDYTLKPTSGLKPTNLSLIFETSDNNSGVSRFINRPNATTGIKSFYRIFLNLLITTRL